MNECQSKPGNLTQLQTLLNFCWMRTCCESLKKNQLSFQRTRTSQKQLNTFELDIKKKFPKVKEFKHKQSYFPKGINSWRCSYMVGLDGGKFNIQLLEVLEQELKILSTLNLRYLGSSRMMTLDNSLESRWWKSCTGNWDPTKRL